MITELGQGQIAVVTGAAQGIGRATTEAFARKGMTVYACDLQGDKLRELARQVENIVPFEMSLTSPDDIQGLVAKVSGDNRGYMRVLFNCAGWVPGGLMRDVDIDDLRRAHELNVFAPYALSQAFGNLMQEQDPGGERDKSIINVGSVASGLLAAPNRSVYGVTKGAVTGLTKATAVEYGASRIRCNEVQPGAVDSESFRERASNPEARKALIDRQPLGTIGDPEDIAHAVIFLAENPYVTGTSVVIDGGWDAFSGAKSPKPPEM